MTMTPSRSYLLSALHQWITDNDLTPYLAVDARVQGVMVPEQFTLDDQLVLNISYSAVQQLSIDQDGVSFNARFGGVPMNIFVPLAAVLAIYARENGQGMGFGMEPGAEELMQLAEQQPPEDSPPTPSGPVSVSSKKGAGSKSRTTLKVVK
ncbi:ClpXP protease specificity-enhancing factor [Nitrincola iocasae]|nr:ClpXP protease specificity-enhancing factor [Nitrincola iocasae]